MGAYVVAALVSLVLGVTGLFGKLLATAPKPITAGVLAGSCCLSRCGWHRPCPRTPHPPGRS
ncbi:putative benzoate:H+ symporter BenE [Kocuria marina]